MQKHKATRGRQGAQGTPYAVYFLQFWIIRANLAECLNALGNRPGVLTALKPLVLPSQTELPTTVVTWKTEIDALNLPADRAKVLHELLEYAILQRLPTLNLAKIRKMLQLTPLEETVAVQQLMQESLEKGMEKGELIGEIRIAQRLLKRPLSSKDTLSRQSLAELQQLLRQLKDELD